MKTYRKPPKDPFHPITIELESDLEARIVLALVAAGSLYINSQLSDSGQSPAYFRGLPIGEVEKVRKALRDICSET